MFTKEYAEYYGDEEFEDAEECDDEDQNVRYKITPKGIACLALLQCGLINTIGDCRAEGFWTIFESGMRDAGYVEDDEDE